MEKTVINVKGMTCGHCEKAVKGAVSELPGVSEVKVNLETGEVTVHYDANKTSLNEMKEAIENQGYDIAS